LAQLLHMQQWCLEQAARGDGKPGRGPNPVVRGMTLAKGRLDHQATGSVPVYCRRN